MDKLIGMVVLLQSTSVLGHSRAESRFPVSTSGLSFEAKKDLNVNEGE